TASDVAVHCTVYNRNAFLYILSSRSPLHFHAHTVQIFQLFAVSSEKHPFSPFVIYELSSLIFAGTTTDAYNSNTFTHISASSSCLKKKFHPHNKIQFGQCQ